jgi:hypothetical protein
VDDGVCVAREWTDARIVVEIRMREFAGELVLVAETATRWRVSHSGKLTT